MNKIRVCFLCFLLYLTPTFSQHSSNGTMLVRYVGEKSGSFSLLDFQNDVDREAILQDRLVQQAEPDFPFQISILPNDPLLNQQWGIANNLGIPFADIGASKAWDIQTHSNGIAGIVDTGIDYSHPDLVDNIWQNLAEDADGDGKVLELVNGKWVLDPGDLDGIDADNNGYIDDLVGWDFVNNDNNPFDDNGHGTHVAGILGASGDNNIGITGVCWSVQLMALKAFDNRGAGSLSTILAALQYARMQGVSLTNNSWGGLNYSQFLLEEIEAANQAGQLFIAAAGNQGLRNPYLSVYPAAYPVDNILSVGAIDIQAQVASFSNTSPHDVDLMAPGWYIFSTLPNGQYGMKTGTSMAAPFVAGAAMLLLAAEPDLGPSAISKRLINTARTGPDFYDKCVSGGQLNLEAALKGNPTIPNSLKVDFSGPPSSCAGAGVSLTNKTIVGGNPTSIQYQWWIDNQLVSTDTHLVWQFAQSGFYGIKLIANANGMTDSLVRPIQVTAAAFADLGPDTAICASAWLLETADPDMSYLWKRLYCDANAPNTYDYGILDSIRVSEHNGQTDGLSAYYILADGLNNILQIRQEPQFAPPGAGNYQVLGFYTSSSTPPSGLQIGNAIGDIAPSSNACSGMSAPLAISVGEESNTDCPITYDFSTLDSIRVSESNGQTEGLNAYYILTDRLSNILQIRPEPLFMPPGAGNYKVYGLYTSLASPPNGLQIDNAIFDVDLSADACGGISAPLDISVAEEEIIGTGLKVVIRESGTYILVATDGCGNTASDTIQITLNEGCVWPGDVNVDGQVSLLDFVSLGLADGQNGPARPNASSIWNSQVANDWGISFDMINQLSPGVDFKHADCDGNGVVDLAMDAEVIKTNLGAFHEIEVPADNMGAELRVEHQNTIFSSLDTAIINLNFYLEGPGQSELEGVYGVLFQLNFSDPVVKAPDFQSDTAGWMSPALEMNAFWDGSQQTPGIQGLREYRKTSGFAMVSDNKVARMGKGGIGGGAVIVTIDDLADDPSLLGFSTFTISVDNLVIVDTAGQLQSVTLASELNTITVQLNWPIGNNILPLDWLDIAVQQVGKDAQLDWHVAAEEGIQYYILERSVDAKAFKPIALLPAKQNGQAENRYQYLDMDVLNSGFSELYYRVKQLDLDGHLSYSEQVSLRLQQNFGLLLRAWPNPHTDQLTIAYQTDQDSPLRLRIVNNMGKELSRQSLFESRGTFTLSTQHWAAGMYYVVLESEHQRSVMKVVKAE